MKTTALPLVSAADGSEEVIINQGAGTSAKTVRMPASLLASAGTRPTPEELKAAILGALVNGDNIEFVDNADGTVTVQVATNPDFKGVPTAPTADPGTDTTQIATTAFVNAAVDVIANALAGKQSTLVEGAGIDIVDNGDGTFTISSTATGGGGSLVDGDYGGIQVSGGGTIMTVKAVNNVDVTVPDEAYGAPWSGKFSVPTKNSLFNKLESLSTDINACVPTAAVGSANGVATLDGTGKVPAAQLPSYVDDVLEYASTTAFPGVGESGKIYVALDTGRQWRWSGSSYTQITASPGTTDNVPEGSTNKYYTDVRVRAAVMSGLVDVAGTPAATDSLITILGKLKRQAFTQLGPVLSGVFSAATLWVNTDKALFQHNGTTGFLRTQTGDLFLGAGGLSHVQITSAGTVALNTGNLELNDDVNYRIKWAGGSNGTIYMNDTGAVYGNDAKHLFRNADGSQNWAEIQAATAWFYADLTVTGYITARGGDVEGGQIVLGYGGGAAKTINGPAASTWNIDVNSANGLRFWRKDGANANVVALTLAESNGDASFVGAITAGGNITSSSDRRLKSDIRPLEDARGILAALDAYRFTMRDKAGVGVIAQEVEAVLPELVETDDEGMLSVDYGKLAAVLIADNNAMAARIAALEAAVEKLTAAA